MTEEQASSSKFNAHKFYDYNNYLSQLSLLAQIVDDDFQVSVQSIFGINRFTNKGIISNEQDSNTSDQDNNVCISS